MRNSQWVRWPETKKINHKDHKQRSKRERAKVGLSAWALLGLSPNFCRGTSRKNTVLNRHMVALRRENRPVVHERMNGRREKGREREREAEKEGKWERARGRGATERKREEAERERERGKGRERKRDRAERERTREREKKSELFIFPQQDLSKTERVTHCGKGTHRSYNVKLQLGQSVG